MSIRYLIAAALMASACAAHADVLPGSSAPASSSDISVKALYDQVSAELGGNSNVTVKLGDDAVYVSGLSSAQALALAGNGMSVIPTLDGFKYIPGVATSSKQTTGGGAAQTGSTGSTSNTTTVGTTSTPVTVAAVTTTTTTTTATINGTPAGDGAGTNLTANATADISGTNGSGSVQAAAANVPEPSSVALMLAGMLGVAGLRRRSR